MKPSEKIENKELLEILGHALKDAGTSASQREPNFPRDTNKSWNHRMPASVRFHYRNHPEMLRMSRSY